MDNDMICKKIIPCLDLNNAVEMAKYYNDAGADEIAYFDSKATKDGREPNVAIIRQICDSVDIPLIACGGVRELEDVKKLLYAGASKVCMKSAALNTPELVAESLDRINIKYRINILNNNCESLKTHTCIYVLLLKLCVVVVSVIVELCKYVVPNLHVSVTVTAYSTARLTAAILLASVIVNL